MVFFARRSALSLLAFAFCATGVWAQGWQHIGAVQRVEKLKDGVELTAGRAKVRITAFNDSVFRVRVVPLGNFPKIRPGPSSLRLNPRLSTLWTPRAS